MPTEFHTPVKLLVEPVDPEDAVNVEWVQQNAGGGGSFEFEQNTPATVWTIAHNLNRRIVAIQVVDGDGNSVIGDPFFVDKDTLTITFARNLAGTAVIRR